MPQFPLKWIGHEDGWLCGFREGKTQEALRELAALACAGCALTRNSRASWVLGPKWWGEVFQGTVCPGPGHLEGPSLHLCHGEPGVWTTHWGLKKKKKSPFVSQLPHPDTGPRQERELTCWAPAQPVSGPEPVKQLGTHPPYTAWKEPAQPQQEMGVSGSRRCVCRGGWESE